MQPYKTARLICTYECNRACAGCVNSININSESKVLPVGFADLAHFNEVVITGGEPLLFVPELIQLASKLRKDSYRTILYTTAPDYSALAAVSRFFNGITITLHNNIDVLMFNTYFKEFFFSCVSTQFFVRIYDDVTIEVHLFNNAQYKMCRWVKPEECKLPPNETLVRLRDLWRK